MSDLDVRPEALREVAEHLADDAAAFVARRRGEVFGDGAPQGGQVQTKSTPTDPVTVVDTETEQLLRDRLALLRPGEPILGEEGGGVSGAGAGVVTWVLDPIDGTVNFVYDIPAYAVSIAAQIDGVSIAGAVAHVATGEVYSAAAGLGAHVRGPGATATRKVLSPNPVDDLSMALVGTGFAYSPTRRAAQAAVLSRLIPVVRDVRRIGSAALDLCMVGAGRLDAYYEHGLHRWDWAAGALVAAEAGAVVQLPERGTSAPALLIAAAPGVNAAFVEALGAVGALVEPPD